MKLSFFAASVVMFAMLAAERASITYDIWFYGFAWVLGFVGGVSATAIEQLLKTEDRNPAAFWLTFWVGVISGHAGVITVGLLARTRGATLDNEPYYLVIATLVGLFGRQSLMIPRQMFRGIVDARVQDGEGVLDLEHDSGLRVCDSGVVRQPKVSDHGNEGQDGDSGESAADPGLDQ